jgi:hypothetical protein
LDFSRTKLGGPSASPTTFTRGDFRGTILLSVVGDVNDFPDEHRLASYFGIVPRVSNSNETERSGRIHKRGSRPHVSGTGDADRSQLQPVPAELLRTVEARRRVGRAIIALAQKFLGIIYRSLKHKVGVRVFPEFCSGGGRMTLLWALLQESRLLVSPPQEQMEVDKHHRSHQCSGSDEWQA